MMDESISFAKRFNQFKISIMRRNVSDRTFLQYYDELNKFLNLPKELQIKSLEVYQNVTRKDLMRGKDFRYTVAACIIAAAREMNTYVAPNSFYGKSKSKRFPDQLDPVLVMRTYKKVLGLEPKYKRTMPDHDAVITSLGKKLMLSEVTVQMARDTCSDFSESLRKRSKTFKPSAIAAASLYFSCQKRGELRTQGEISKLAGVSEVTIRNVLKDLNSQHEKTARDEVENAQIP